MTLLFEQLYNEYIDDIHRYIYLHVHNIQIAEDLTQDTFIKVYRSLDTYQSTGSIKAWIFQIAKHTTYDYYRKNKWAYLFATTLKESHVYHHSFENELERDAEIHTLYTAMKQLKKDYQEVLILRKINEFSIKETAEILNWSENKVKKKLERALIKLQRTLQLEEDILYVKR